MAGPDLEYKFTNSAYRGLIPNPVVDPVGRRFRDIWPRIPDTDGEVQLQNVLQTGQAINGYRFVRTFPDGSVHYFSSHLRSLPWQGQPAVLMVMWETTAVEEAHRLAEQAAAEVRRRADELSSVIAAMTEIVIVYDAHGKPLHANPAVLEAFGFTPVDTGREILVDKLFLSRPDGKPICVEELPSTRALRGETIKGERLTFTNARGEKMIVLASASPLYHNDTLFGAVEVWNDVTEREGLLAQLEDERARLSTIIANAPEAIVVADSLARIVFVNPLAERLYRHPVPIGKVFESHPDLQFCYPDGSPCNSRDLPLTRSALDGETQANLELAIVWSDGQQRSILVNSAPILDRKGTISGAIAMFQDITQRKQAEEETLRNATRVEVQQHLMQYREKERLLIARDLHDGPVQELIGIEYALSEIWTKVDDEMIAEKVETVLTSLKRQIKDLRGFSSQLRPPALIHFGLEKAIRSHADSFHEKYKDISVRLDLEPDGKTLSENNRLALFRVFQELMNNVARHAEASEVTVRFRLSESTAELVVQDNGRGFEVPRRWLDLARAGHLGLVGIQERVQAVGGTFVIDSSPGKGSIVHVVIPLESSMTELLDEKSL